jgi:hypothetical protein
MVVKIALSMPMSQSFSRDFEIWAGVRRYEIDTIRSSKGVPPQEL